MGHRDSPAGRHGTAGRVIKVDDLRDAGMKGHGHQQASEHDRSPHASPIVKHEY